MALSYLFDPNMQFQDKGGKNNVNGFLRVYIDGTDDRATTYRDFNETLNAADIRIDNNGRAVVIADSEKAYRVEVYSASGALLWTQHPVFPQGGGGGSFEQVQSDWAQSNSSAVDFIKNKPDLGNFLEKNGDGKDVTVTFNDASERTNIGTGEKLSVLFSKIKKWLSDLKTVAFSGSYNDLSDKPTIPAAQVQSDWNEADNTKADYIKNKPSIPDVSGKLNINGDNATAAGSSAIVDKISYNADPTIDDTSNILHKNGNGFWEKISLSGIWGYIKSKFVPVISHGYKTASKTVVSGEENYVTLSPAIELPTKRARYAVAIISVSLGVDPNGTSLASVSDKARIDLDIDGNSIDAWFPVFEDGFYRVASKTTFQFLFSPSLYPSTVTASVYSLNAPVGSRVQCYFHITLLGCDTNF